jgi:hypothetical protein
MKNTNKVFGLALIAAIGFTALLVTACPGGGSNNGGNDNGKTVIDIAITAFPTKTTYVVGDKLDTSGMVVKAFYSDGSNQDVTNYTTNFDSSTAGTKTFTVSYGGKTATTTFTVTVYAKGGSGTFNSIYDFEVWLTAQPDNTATSPHTAKLNLSSLEGAVYTVGSVGYIISANANKYLILDLSGSSITSIVDFAFQLCSNLIGVTIPNSVTSIGWSAFNGCTSLTNVTIPDSVTSIDSGAFNVCISLTSVNIPNSVTSIGSGAFSNCRNLTSVIIPNKVTTIEEGVFKGCTRLASVTIPAGVTSIKKEAFSGCSSLENVIIPAAVTSIGESAFANCTGFTSVTFLGEITSSGFNTLAFTGSGNLRDKYFDTNGGIGTYVRAKGGSAWTKQ